VVDSLGRGFVGSAEPRIARHAARLMREAPRFGGHAANRDDSRALGEKVAPPLNPGP
jgi:hypothetical protein